MSNPERPFGWRKRIGLLSPTVIETAAYDFYRLAPDGVSMCATTSNIDHWSPENFKQHVLDPIVTAVNYLASRHVDYIIHTGMPVVTTRGKGFEEELVKQIEERRDCRHHQHPLRHPRTRASRCSQRRGGVALSQGIASVGALFPRRERLSVVADQTMDVVFKELQDVTPRRSPLPPCACSPRTRGGGRLYPVQSMVGSRCRAADRERDRRAGGDRRACRLLGGVSLSRNS